MNENSEPRKFVGLNPEWFEPGPDGVIPLVRAQHAEHPRGQKGKLR